jgi:hypothetical protein
VVRKVQPVQDRQDESGGLAGAGLGDGNQVVALQDLGDRGCLHRRGAGVSCFSNGKENPRIKAKVAERHGRSIG